MNHLPIIPVLPQIIAALTDERSVVLKAPPGAGKTTAVPPAILEAGVITGTILLIQPRRLAARTAAARLAQLVGTPLGQRVGYQVRFDRRVSQNTQVIVMTTGILLRRLQNDPLLEDVGCVILDEFHERSVELDLALGMLTRVRQTLRPELKMVVMSATLDPAPIAHFLGDAVAIESEGRSFPVEVQYADGQSQDPLETQISHAIVRALSATSGDLLVFLPGVGEIRRCHRSLQEQASQQSLDIHELYGDLPAEKQDAVLVPSSRRKIILATNVAETSITIDGVTGVIDSGQARVMQFDSRRGLPQLQRQPISQASAQQRSGRAGRTAPGIAYRLWSAASHRSRPLRDQPEVERCDLSGPLLMLAAWGERDPFDFPWLTPPLVRAVEQGTDLLKRLGAIDSSSTLTSTGQQMQGFPLPPRMSCFMMAASELGCPDDAALAAAMLTERDPFRGSSLTFMQRLESLRDFDGNQRSIDNHSGTNRSTVNPSAIAGVLRVAKQIRRLLPKAPSNPRSPPENAIVQSLLAAYPDRVARHREGDPRRGVMVGGRGVRLNPSQVSPHSDLVLCLEIDSAGQEAKVPVAVAIDESWLDPSGITVRDQPQFDSSLQAVVARRQRRYHDLLLSESPIQCQPNDRVAGMLFDAARPQLDRIFAKSSSELSRWIDRAEFLAHQMPQLDLPPFGPSAIDDTLRLLCQTRTKMAELERAPWLDHFRGRYSYHQNQLMDQHAPTRYHLPSGNSVTILYEEGKPKMEVRIQELFGLLTTPRVAGDRVPITMHLLGPNYRPQQITEDLENFWNETYAQVRKDLRGRYPKHHWPENPTTAKATSNGLKPK